MKLPFSFLKPKKEVPVYYLALLLTSEKTTAIILEEIQGKLKIVSRSKQYFEETVEELRVDDLIGAVDRAVTEAVAVLPADAEIRKTVFGVKENWVEKESKKIKKDYLQKLKKVCDALDLTPIGFMVAAEAITNLIQKDEGVPVSAILIEHGRKELTLTLVRGGKNIQTVEGKIEESEAGTADKLLKHFTIEVLPARIILYDDEAGEELVQQFTGFAWSKSLPFLHIPQISVLPAGYDGQAVAYGAAVQMGFEVLESEIKTIKTYNKNESDEKVSVHEDQETRKDSGEKGTGIENFGFIMDQDISEIKRESPVEKHEHTVIHSDSLTSAEADEAEEVEDTRLEELAVEDKGGGDENWRDRIFDKIKMPKIGIPNFPFKGILIGILVIAFCIGGAVFGAYYLYASSVKASVIVNLASKKIAMDRDVVFSSDTDADFKENKLAAKLIQDSLSGDMTIGTTGKKEVGEHAKGSVVIFSKLAQTKKFSSGTIITSNGREFTLDRDIEVASSSGDASSDPSKATVAVSAKEIGKDSNLPSGSKFTVAGFDQSDVVAKNESAFSGGTSKTIKVIANEDLTELKTSLIKNLEEKALEALKKKSSPDSTILPVILTTEAGDTKFSGKAGDEANTIKLTTSIDYTGLAYSRDEAKKFARSAIEEKYGRDMTFNEDVVDIEVKDADRESDSEISATVTILASLLPKIDTTALSKELGGKSKTAVSNVLSHLPQAENTQVKYSPDIYFLENVFQNFPNNVSVTIASN